MQECAVCGDYGLHEVTSDHPFLDERKQWLLCDEHLPIIEQRYENVSYIEKHSTRYHSGGHTEVRRKS